MVRKFMKSHIVPNRDDNEIYVNQNLLKRDGKNDEMPYCAQFVL